MTANVYTSRNFGLNIKSCDQIYFYLNIGYQMLPWRKDRLKVPLQNLLIMRQISSNCYQNCWRNKEDLTLEKKIILPLASTGKINKIIESVDVYKAISPDCLQMSANITYSNLANIINNYFSQKHYFEKTKKNCKTNIQERW